MKSLNEETAAKRTYGGAGVTNELDAMSVSVLNVTTTGPNACLDVIVKVIVEMEGADTCSHKATH